MTPEWPAGLLVRRLLVRIRTDEQLPPVGKREIAAVGAVGAVLGLVAFYYDLGPRLQRVFREAAAQQGIRTPALDHPTRDRAVHIFDVHVDPGVRIDPLHLGDDTLQLHRL